MFDINHLYVGGEGHYAKDAPEGMLERPNSPYFSRGVNVRFTAVAKWWNWLFNFLTVGINASVGDKRNMLAEMENLLSAAELTPSNSNNNTKQCAQSYEIIAVNNTREYDEAVETIRSNTRPVNRPYMSGTTIVLPDTELL